MLKPWYTVSSLLLVEIPENPQNSACQAFGCRAVSKGNQEGLPSETEDNGQMALTLLCHCDNDVLSSKFGQNLTDEDRESDVRVWL